MKFLKEFLWGLTIIPFLSAYPNGISKRLPNIDDFSGPPPRKMQMSIQLEPNDPKLNDTVTVTFRFIALDAIPTKKKLGTRVVEDIDKAILGLPDGAVLIKGSIQWEGNLIIGQQNLLEAEVMLTRPGKHYFLGTVYSQRVKNVSPELELKGIQSYCYINRIASEKFFIPGKLSPKKKSSANKQGDIIIRQEGEEFTSPPDADAPEIEIVPAPSSRTPSEDRDTTQPKPTEEEKLPDQKNKAEASLANQIWTVSGYFRYVDNFGFTEDLNELLVIFRRKDVYGNWVIYDSTFTNQNGYFQHATADTEIQVRGYSISKGANCFLVGNHRLDDTSDVILVRVWTVSVLNRSGQDLLIPDSFTTITDLSFAGAYNLCNIAATAYDYLLNLLGYLYRPPRGWIYWDPLDTDSSVVSSFAAFSIGGLPGITIKSRNTPPEGDPDEWDDGVVLHEYGHYAMWYYADSPPNSGGPHLYWLPANYLQSQIPRQVAYSEGWAWFFQAAVRNNTAFFDNDQYGIAILHLDLEQPEPDVPFISYYNWLYQDFPSSTDTVYTGYNVEGSTAEVLWDIFDVTNDGNYYQGSEIYGHNNDYNQGDWWRGISSIWDVFWNYDPAPSDFDHDHPWDFYEFVAGWEDLGYPVAGHFTDILNSHGLQICVAIAGDANASGDLSLGDVIAITNYVFNKPGCSPQPICWLSGLLCRGDWNASGDVSLGDIIQAVNYVYNKPGGPWDPLSSDVCCLPVP